MKKLIRVVFVLILLLAIAVVAGFVYMDKIATAAVQKAAAYATECDVAVGKVDVKPMSGEATIADLEIKNPSAGDVDFRAIHDSFMVLKSGEAGVSLGTLRSDMVEVPKVVIDGVELSLIGRDGATNYETIIASLQRLQGEEAPADTAADGKQFVIRTVELTNIVVHVDMDEDPALGLAPVKLDLTLKPITLTDVGSGGVPLSQISADLIADILVQVIAQLGNQLGDRILSGLTSGLSGLLGPDVLQGQLSDITSSLGLDSIDVSAQLDMAGELLGGVGEGVGDIVGGATDGVGGLLEGAGGLLGGDEDEEGDGEEDEGGLLDGARGLLGGDE